MTINPSEIREAVDFDSEDPPIPPDDLDFYELLNVDEHSDFDEVKEKKRGLASLYHPDSVESQEAKAVFNRINRAGEVLTDPNKRKAYNYLGHEKYHELKKKYGIKDVLDEYVPDDVLNAPGEWEQDSESLEEDTNQSQSKAGSTSSFSVSRVPHPFSSKGVAVTGTHSFFSRLFPDDDLSKRVWWNWGVRCLESLLCIVFLLSMTTIASRLGVSSLPFLGTIPTLDSFLNLTPQFVLLVFTVFVLFYLVDQHLTTQSGFMDGITPSTTGLNLAQGIILLSSVLLSLFFVFVSPITVASGVTPVTVLKSVLAVFIGSSATLILSRWIWYTGYVLEYRLKPGVWDILLCTPFVFLVLTVGSGGSPIPLPAVLDSASQVAPLFFTSTSVSPGGVLMLLVLVPAVTSLVFLVRSLYEYVFRIVLTA